MLLYFGDSMSKEAHALIGYAIGTENDAISMYRLVAHKIQSNFNTFRLSNIAQRVRARYKEYSYLENKKQIKK